MSELKPAGRVRVEVIYCRWDMPDRIYRMDEICSEIGVKLRYEGESLPGNANILLGVVEVPSDADLSVISMIRIDQSPGPQWSFENVTLSTDQHGQRWHDVTAEKILDVANNPKSSKGLNIRLIHDYRPQGIPIL